MLHSNKSVEIGQGLSNLFLDLIQTTDFSTFCVISVLKSNKQEPETFPIDCIQSEVEKVVYQ